MSSSAYLPQVDCRAQEGSKNPHGSSRNEMPCLHIAVQHIPKTSFKNYATPLLHLLLLLSWVAKGSIPIVEVYMPGRLVNTNLASRQCQTRGSCNRSQAGGESQSVWLCRPRANQVHVRLYNSAQQKSHSSGVAAVCHHGVDAVYLPCTGTTRCTGCHCSFSWPVFANLHLASPQSILSVFDTCSCRARGASSRH